MHLKTRTHISSNRQGGFTFIEILLALGIFSIGILAVASLQLWNLKNNTTGNVMTQATMLAREKLEELKNAEDDNVKSAAALEILSSLKPSTNGEFIFFLDNVKLDDALKLKSFLRSVFCVKNYPCVLSPKF